MDSDKLLSLAERLTKRANELPQEIAERENEAAGVCGPYGTETAADYMDDSDRLLMLDAATAIRPHAQQVKS